MATSKSASRSGQSRSGSSNGSGSKAKKSGASRSGGGASQRSQSASARSRSSAGRSANGSARSSGSGSATKRPQSRSKSSPAQRSPATRRRTSQTDNSFVGNVKSAASKVSGPAVAVGAGVAGIAGGLAIKSLTRPKKVLGVPVPRALRKAGLPDLDVKSVAKTVGKASQRFAESSKNVSKDIEKVGDQAERIGKILG